MSYILKKTNLTASRKIQSTAKSPFTQNMYQRSDIYLFVLTILKSESERSWLFFS